MDEDTRAALRLWQATDNENDAKVALEKLARHGYSVNYAMLELLVRAQRLLGSYAGRGASDPMSDYMRRLLLERPILASEVLQVLGHTPAPKTPALPNAQIEPSGDVAAVTGAAGGLMHHPSRTSLLDHLVEVLVEGRRWYSGRIVQADYDIHAQPAFQVALLSHYPRTMYTIRGMHLLRAPRPECLRDGHQFTDWLDDCRTCSVCGVTEERAPTRTLPHRHRWSMWRWRNLAGGAIERDCQTCGEVMVREPDQQMGCGECGGTGDGHRVLGGMQSTEFVDGRLVCADCGGTGRDRLK